MPVPSAITAVCEQLLNTPWRDADSAMDPAHVMKTEAGMLVASFGAEGEAETYRRLSWLAFFAARRALACWDLYCDGDEPHQTVAAMGDRLIRGQTAQGWGPHVHAAVPSYGGQLITDCRKADTSCAAEAVAGAARFMQSRKPSDAACALSAASMAFDQSPVGGKEEFHRWLLDVAVPAAHAARELTEAEQGAFRTFTDAELKEHREGQAPY